MKAEDFKAKTAEIMANLTDQAKVSILLAELNEDYDAETVTKTTAIATAEKLVKDNENLRSTNMQLFLKVGEPLKTEPTKTVEDDKPKYEDLFDENGNLK